MKQANEDKSRSADRAQDEDTRSSSLFRRKHKSDTRGSKVESPPRPRKLARKQEDSVSQSGSTVAKDLNPQGEADSMRRSGSQGTNRNVDSKKGKKKYATNRRRQYRFLAAEKPKGSTKRDGVKVTHVVRAQLHVPHHAKRVMTIRMPHKQPSHPSRVREALIGTSRTQPIQLLHKRSSAITRCAPVWKQLSKRNETAGRPAFTVGSILLPNQARLPLNIM